MTEDKRPDFRTRFLWNGTEIRVILKSHCLNFDCWTAENLVWENLGFLTEKAMAPHSSTLAWKIPWTEEPGRLRSMGSLRVGHDWTTSLSLFTFMHWRRKWQPTPVFLPEESQGRGAWWAAIYGVAQSRTQLKWLSSLAAGCLRLLTRFFARNWSALEVQSYSYRSWWKAEQVNTGLISADGEPILWPGNEANECFDLCVFIFVCHYCVFPPVLGFLGDLF